MLAVFVHDVSIGKNSSAAKSAVLHGSSLALGYYIPLEQMAAGAGVAFDTSDQKVESGASDGCFIRGDARECGS